MKLNKEQEEILEDIFIPHSFEHPVMCRLCNQIIEEGQRLAHLNTFHIEFSREYNKDPEFHETYPDRIVKLHDEAIRKIEKIEDEKQRSLDRYEVQK